MKLAHLPTTILMPQRSARRRLRLHARRSPIQLRPHAQASPSFEFAYALTSYAVSMFTVNSCNGQFSCSTPDSISTGYASPQDDAEADSRRPARPIRLRRQPRLQRLRAVHHLHRTPSTPPPASSPQPPPPPSTPAGFPRASPSTPRAASSTPPTPTPAPSPCSPSTRPPASSPPPRQPPSPPSSLAKLLSDPGFLTVDPTGNFLYAPASTSDGSTVSMYSINQTTGLLTPLSPATVITGGIPSSSRYPRTAAFAYVVNNLSGGDLHRRRLSIHRQPHTGVLTQNTPAAVPAGNAPTAIAIDPTNSYAYVVNRNDNTLSMYSINPTTGSLPAHRIRNQPHRHHRHRSPALPHRLRPERKIPLRHQRGRPHLHLHRQQRTEP